MLARDSKPHRTIAATQAEQRSGVFWGRCYNKHVITGNIAAGVLDGSGFFLDLASPAGKGGDEGEGMVFEDNTAHSSFKALNTGNQINYPEATAGHGTTGSAKFYAKELRELLESTPKRAM